MATNALTISGERELLPPPSEWKIMKEMAEDLVKSGMLPAHIKTPQAAIAVMLKGRELRVPPMQAFNTIWFLQGKTTAMAELMNALIIRDCGPGALQITHTDHEACTIRYWRPGYAEAREYTFTIEDARRAKLTGDNWIKYPAPMLRARCITSVAKMAFPDIVSGMYTPDELGADVTVDEDGSMQIARVQETPMRAVVTPISDAPQGKAPMDSHLKRLWITAREHGWEEDTLKKAVALWYPYAKDDAGNISTKLLKREHVEQLTEWVSEHGPDDSDLEDPIVVEDAGDGQA